jgi:thiosulfate reductase cytochrome b subunit
MAAIAEAQLPKPKLIYRHPLYVRLAHWLNVLCLLALLPSGLQILNAHPAFYWGEASRFAHPFLAIGSAIGADGASHGHLQLGAWSFDTTGWLGVSNDADGNAIARAFPASVTLPREHDLGAGRHWHFLFAWIFVINGVLYLASAIATRRVARVLLPGAGEMRSIGRSIRDHLRLRSHQGSENGDYNILQKLSYLAVIFGLLPLMVLTGLTMSPSVDASAPFLTTLFGGRQTARSIHFLSASGLCIFFVVHIVMVVITQPLNLLRSIVTGWFRVGGHEAEPERAAND